MPIFCWIIVIWKILRENQALGLKAPVLILNSNGEVIVRKMFDNTTQANWNRHFGLLNKLVLLSDYNQSEFADASLRRGEQNGVIIAGVPFLLSLIPSLFFPPAFFSFLPPSPPLLTPIFGRNELLLKDQFNPRKWKKKIVESTKLWSDELGNMRYFYSLSMQKFAKMRFQFTFGLRYIHGQSLTEIDSPTRNAVDGF